MINKKLSSIILSASLLAPTTAVVESFDVDCVEAATEFIASDTPLNVNSASCLYGMPPGDVNYDFKVDISDYTLLKKYINTGGSVKINEAGSDINSDGAVTFLDLLLLKNYI